MLKDVCRLGGDAQTGSASKLLASETERGVGRRDRTSDEFRSAEGRRVYECDSCCQVIGDEVEGACRRREGVLLTSEGGGVEVPMGVNL